MRYIKTYGIYGLFEWHGTIQFGQAKLNLSFTNGTTSATGVAPATYITDNPLNQTIIEHSDKFMSGKIRLINATPIPGSEKEGKPVEPAGDAAGTTADAAGTEQEGNHGVDTIEVADKSEAVEWLKEHYPDKEYTGVKLRSKEACENACKECNVEFVIKNA